MRGDTPALNIIEPFNDFLAVDYEQQGDQWLQALSQSIQQKLPNTNGYSLAGQQASSDFQYPHFELVINTSLDNTAVPADIPALKIVPLTQQDGSKALYVALASTRPITEDDKRVWVESINEAVTKLNEDSPEFEWAAVLGQTNDPTTQKYSLRKSYTTNGITVRSGRKQYIDYHLPSSTPHFNGSTFSLSWPVIIEGRSKGFDWPVASRQAGIETHRIAVLLSIAWDSTWYLLQSPIVSPRSTLKIPDNMLYGHKQPHFPHPKKVKVIPAWVDKAWTLIDSDSDIESAVTAYYQGLMLEDAHPSFALIAFIAAIEIIGKKIVGDKCTCCGKPTGSNQAFRAGVDAVITNRQVAKELYLLYKSRSGTAHEGELHADENILGYLSFPSVFKSDNKSMFIVRDLLRIKATSRKLLVRVLKEQVRYSRHIHHH